MLARSAQPEASGSAAALAFPCSLGQHPALFPEAWVCCPRTPQVCISEDIIFAFSSARFSPGWLDTTQPRVSHPFPRPEPEQPGVGGDPCLPSALGFHLCHTLSSQLVPSLYPHLINSAHYDFQAIFRLSPIFLVLESLFGFLDGFQFTSKILYLPFYIVPPTDRLIMMRNFIC